MFGASNFLNSLAHFLNPLLKETYCETKISLAENILLEKSQSAITGTKVGLGKKIESSLKLAMANITLRHIGKAKFVLKEQTEKPARIGQCYRWADLPCALFWQSAFAHLSVISRLSAHSNEC